MQPKINMAIIRQYMKATTLNELPFNVLRLLDITASRWIITNETAIAERKAKIEAEILEKQQEMSELDAKSLEFTAPVVAPE
jgi:hypothetical protein